MILSPINTNLSLRIIEISRNGDDSVLHRWTVVILSCFFHFHQHERPDLTWWIRFAIGFDPSITVRCSHDFEGNTLPRMTGDDHSISLHSQHFTFLSSLHHRWTFFQSDVLLHRMCFEDWSPLVAWQAYQRDAHYPCWTQWPTGLFAYLQRRRGWNDEKTKVRQMYLLHSRALWVICLPWWQHMNWSYPNQYQWCGLWLCHPYFSRHL